MDNPEDENYWMKEAQAVIDDVKNHIKKIEVSSKLENSNRCVYINIQVLEGMKYCIKLSAIGFQLVGHDFDNNCLQSESVYETPQSLIASLSTQFVQSFGEELSAKLFGIL